MQMGDAGRTKMGEISKQTKNEYLQFKKATNRSQAQMGQEMQQEQLDIRELSI